MTLALVRDAALAYLRVGLSVIPTCRQDKKPLIAWKEFQIRHATEGEVLGWYRRWPDGGVAIVCGAVSGVVVVDADPRNGHGFTALAPRLPQTPTVETGGGGRHYYFAVSGRHVPKIPALLPGVDLQAEASYALAPPTIHPNGRPYSWLPGHALAQVPLAPLPPVIRQLITLHRNRKDEERPRGGRANFISALTLDAVLSTLHGVRRCGRGWVALCPVHDDREQSLSVGEGDGGKVLLHCFAGCAFADVLHVLLEGRRAWRSGST